MFGRAESRRQPSGAPARRLLAGVTGTALAATAIATLAVAGPAGADPTPNYQSGTDNATFTVTGVLDRNCLVSTGGNKVFIKPGDAINFNSSLAGVDVGGLSLGSGSLAGLDVSATIDAGKSAQRSVKVAGGKSVKVSGLSSGKHTLQWNATGIPLASGLLGSAATLPLHSDDLRSGAKLSWSGKIYVTKGAARCSVAVLTPEGDVSLGPVHVSVPSAGINIPGATLPKSVPSVPNLAPSKSGGAKSDKPRSGSRSSSKNSNKPTSDGLSAVVPGLTIPQQVVPGSGSGGGGISGGGGGYRGNLPNSTSQLAGANGDGTVAIAADGSVIHLAPVPGSKADSDSQTVDLASANPDAGSGQLPVLLAILAIITLALVAGTYARMFLLRRST